MGLTWIIAGVVTAITIVGHPWRGAAFNIAIYTFMPFGQRVVSRAEYRGFKEVGTGALGFIGKINWFALGWWLALGETVIAEERRTDVQRLSITDAGWWLLDSE